MGRRYCVHAAVVAKIQKIRDTDSTILKQSKAESTQKTPENTLRGDKETQKAGARGGEEKETAKKKQGTQKKVREG